MRVGAQRDLELMAEDQVLEREVPARANGSHESIESEPKQFERPSGYQQVIGRNSLTELDRLLPPFTSQSESDATRHPMGHQPDWTDYCPPHNPFNRLS